tara:strand:- start:326 stop:775 length:450 start_codon:yes stop_codon:yes gene_type:complete
MKILRVSLVIGLIALVTSMSIGLVGCQSSSLEGYLEELEQRLITLENPPPLEEDTQYLEDFRNLESRIAELEEPNPYLTAAGIFYAAFLKMEAGDRTGEAEVLQAILFDEELSNLWREVIMGQKPVYHFMYVLWIKAFEVKEDVVRGRL